MNTKKIFAHPKFVEAFVDTILSDLSAAHYILGGNGSRAVSMIKTKLSKTVRNGLATVTCVIPELDTKYVMQIAASSLQNGNFKYNPYKASL